MWENRIEEPNHNFALPQHVAFLKLFMIKSMIAINHQECAILFHEMILHEEELKDLNFFC